MADAANEWARRGQPSWLVTPSPRKPFLSALGRPFVRDLVNSTATGVRVVSPSVDYVFELGTPEYRARVYANAVRTGIPPGVPIIVSDDPDVWRAAALVSDRNAFIGVMHADDEAYYQLARRYQGVLAALVCVSSRIDQTTRSRLAAGSKLPIYTIPCGIPLSPWRASSVERSGVRMAWAGRIEERQKRVSDLVPILVRARSEGIEVTLDVLGDGPERVTVEQAAIRAGVSSAIAFHGWQPVDRVIERLHDSDVFLLTSNFEGMPVTVMEALASGCPVVSSRVSGIEDYSELPLAQGALETFPVGDITGAVDRLRKVLSLPKRVRQERARKLAEAEFSIETCMTRYESVHSRAVVQTGKGPSVPHRAFAGSYMAASILASARQARFRFWGHLTEKNRAAV
jgi:glycosyltransferase involved in cell wall biosynthesis